jgi:hypothetical protein
MFEPLGKGIWSLLYALCFKATPNMTFTASKLQLYFLQVYISLANLPVK